MEKNHHERMKTLSDETKNTKEHYEKTKKTLIEAEEQAKAQATEVKKENS